MPNINPESSSQAELAQCGDCAGDLRLAAIQPGPPGFNLRTYECPHCGHAETHEVKL